MQKKSFVFQILKYLKSMIKKSFFSISSYSVLTWPFLSNLHKIFCKYWKIKSFLVDDICFILLTLIRSLFQFFCLFVCLWYRKEIKTTKTTTTFAIFTQDLSLVNKIHFCIYLCVCFFLYICVRVYVGVWVWAYSKSCIAPYRGKLHCAVSNVRKIRAKIYFLALYIKKIS